MTRRERIGILGGTFDPVHIGHLHIAMCARHDLRLDRVMLMPAGAPPHKPDNPVTPGTLRLEMVQAAVHELPGVEASDLDMQGTQPSYTSELLAQLRRTYINADLWFIIGSDSLQDFPSWHQPKSILGSSRLAVAERPGWPIDELLQETPIPELTASVDVFSSVHIELSSTVIRGRLREGLPVDWLIPSTVSDIVRTHRIYLR